MPAVEFAGSFADTKVVRDHFVTDASPEMVLKFYRQHVLAQGADVVECRSTVSIQRRHGVARPVCLDRESSPMMQLAVGNDRRHVVVSVQARGTGAEYSLIRVETR